MTKVYIRSATGELNVEDNGETRTLDGSSDAKAALSILMDALGNEERARELHGRFNWRVVKEANKGFRITLEKVLATVADIEKVHNETAMGRAIVAREPAPVVSDRGAGVVWDLEHK